MLFGLFEPLASLRHLSQQDPIGSPKNVSINQTEESITKIIRTNYRDLNCMKLDTTVLSMCLYHLAVSWSASQNLTKFGCPKNWQGFSITILV